jgi:cytidylate kinase
MAVITITREMATGGRELGRLLARRLDYQYVDKSLFQNIAKDLNVSERTLESFEKSKRIIGYDERVVD